MKKINKLLSVVLTFCIAISLLPGFAFADTEFESYPEVLQESVLFELPDIVDAAEARKNDYIGRVKSEEKDLNTFVFANGDGTTTMRVYSHPVKYSAADGSVRDISLDINPKAGGGFVTADHEIITTFARELSDGISLEYADIDISLAPSILQSIDPVASISSDNKTVTYHVDDATAFVYNLTYSGFKEDIVVSRYTGQTEYRFTLSTGGLALCEEQGSYYLADSEGNKKAFIGDIIVFTDDERNNTLGSMTFETVLANHEYILTIHLDPEYLSSEDTKYPIRIDPTISINYGSDGAGAIEDVTINERATFGGTSGSLYIGRQPAGSLSRVLMRFPTLSLSGIGANQITAASVEIRDLMCQGDEDITIECRIYKNTAPAWSESGTTTWASVGETSIGDLLDSHLVSYGNGNVSGSNQRYSFNILNAAKAWASGTQSPAKGLVFKAQAAFENQTGSDIKCWYKTFSSYNRPEDYKPSLSITYTNGIYRNLYYSKYDPDKYNDNGTGSNSAAAQYRMNCYGYAFGFIYNGGSLPYKQQPGEFAKAGDKSKTMTLHGHSTADAYMNAVVNNIKLDAARVGYTLTEYTTTSSSVGQFGSSSRLIAVVTGSDYHFYMQHNDGTWSHKPGVTEVTNRSIDTNEILTNSNIKRLANQGYYANGALKFFIITKSAVVDYPHGALCCGDENWPCSHAQSTFNLNDVAGDYLQTSKRKFIGSCSGRIDFAQDHDVYYFTPTSTGTYTITTSCSSGADLDCKVYDRFGEIMMVQTNVGQVNFTATLESGKTYYFDVYNYSKTITDYTFTLS